METMNILVINSGSSSIKYQLIEMVQEQTMASGLVERIGEEQGRLKTVFYPGTEREESFVLETRIRDHSHGMQRAIVMLMNPENGVLHDSSGIAAVGHRVVHGGEDFQQSCRITSEVVNSIKRNVPLAPLHNPPNLDGIRIAMEMFPAVPHVAVFDTAFHQRMPAHVFMYALPYELYEEHRVRRYGFHGTSHGFVAAECARLLGKPLAECNLITAHLGNGCSMAAIEKGISVDTSLGMTPLEGLVMGTRSGDVDPALHLFLQQNRGMDMLSVNQLLNKDSGLKGLCGINDMRDIHHAIAQGNPRAQLALDVQTYRNRKYIAAYIAVLGEVDALVFTGGIGENDPITRAKSLERLKNFGLQLDEEKNRERSTAARCISREQSPIKIFVIPTNEELAIARETQRLTQ